MSASNPRLLISNHWGGVELHSPVLNYPSEAGSNPLFRPSGAGITLSLSEGLFIRAAEKGGLKPSPELHTIKARGNSLDCLFNSHIRAYTGGRVGRGPKAPRPICYRDLLPQSATWGYYGDLLNVNPHIRVCSNGGLQRSNHMAKVTSHSALCCTPCPFIVFLQTL